MGWAFINLADRCGVSGRREDEYYIIYYYYYYEEAILPSSDIALYRHSRSVRRHLSRYIKFGLVLARSDAYLQHTRTYIIVYNMRDYDDDDYYYYYSSVVFGPTATAAAYICWAIRLYSSRRLTISHLILGAPPIHIPPLRA